MRAEMEEELSRRTRALELEALAAHEARAASIQQLRMKVSVVERIAVFHQNYDSITRDTHRRRVLLRIIASQVAGVVAVVVAVVVVVVLLIIASQVAGVVVVVVVVVVLVVLVVVVVGGGGSAGAGAGAGAGASSSAAAGDGRVVGDAGGGGRNGRVGCERGWWDEWDG
jgi:hypothetical protein